MRIIKWFLNLLLLAISYCLISVCTFSVYSLVCLQADDRTARISIVDEPDRVSFFDSYSYWGTAISTEISNKLPDPKIRVANWFSWGWWKTAGGAVDTYVVNPVVAIIKPIILPINCADEIKEYYDKDITYYVSYIDKDPITFSKMAWTYFDAEIETNVEYGVHHIDTTQLAEYKNNFKLSNIVGQDKDGNGKQDVYDVADDFNYFYQLLYKLHKYNKTSEKYVTESNPEGYIYYKWFHKFVRTAYDEHGVEIDKTARTLSTGVYGLYFLSYINIILALIFLYLNPIEIARNEDGSVSPKNNVFSHFTWRHKRRQANKQYREERREEKRARREEKIARRENRRRRKEERRQRRKH